MVIKMIPDVDKEHMNALEKYKWFYAVLLFIVLTNVLFFIVVRVQEKMDFIEVGKTATMQTSEALGIWIEDQQKLSGLISGSHEVLDWIKEPGDHKKKAELTTYLSRIISRYSQFENIQVVGFNDPDHPWGGLSNGEYKIDGVTLMARPTIYDGIEDTGTVEAITEKRPYFISSIFSSADVKRPLFYFSVPIIEDQKTKGILTFCVRLSSLTDGMINEVEYGKTGYLFLIDDRGKTIAHKTSSYIMSDANYLQDIVNNLLTHLSIGESYFRGNFQGDWKKYYGVLSGLEKENMRNQWYIVFTQKEWEIYLLANRMFAINILTLIGFVLIFALYRKRQLKLELKLSSDYLMGEEMRNYEAELQAKTREAAKQINLDPLTQINHFQSIQRLIEQYLIETPSDQCSLCLILFHVDKMGEFNEREGIGKGDIVLNHIGKLSSEHFNDHAMVGRVYGDVFAVILYQRNLIETLVQVEQFRKKYEQINLNFIDQKPSLSFGIAQWENESSAQLILRAEHQLKRAKQQGERQIKY